MAKVQNKNIMGLTMEEVVISTERKKEGKRKFKLMIITASYICISKPI
jgi:hypothetical protein